MPNRPSRSPWIVVGTLAIGCAIGCLLGAPLPAHAAGGDTAAATATGGTAAAKAHFKAGTTDYDLGKYDDAIREFEAAYEAKSDPAFLFNLAQANRLGGHPAEALHFYRTYLRYVPNPPNLADIEANVRTLERTVAEKAAPGETTGETPESPPRSMSEASLSPPPPPPAPASPATGTAVAPAPLVGAPPVLPSAAEPSRPAASDVTASAPGPAATTSSAAGAPAGLSSRKNVGKVLAVVGVAVFGTGLAFGLAAGAQSRKVESATTFDPAVEKSGKSFDTLKWIGVVVGAVTAAAGAVLYLTAGKTPEASAESTPRTALLPLAGSHFGGALLQVSFR